MKDNKNIKDILDDLYKIDPFLEQYEEKVKEAVKELLKSKPDVKIDAKFVAELREKILDRAEQLKYAPQKKQGIFSIFSLAPKFAYAFGGLMVIILAVGLYFHFSGSGNNAVIQIGQQPHNGEIKTTALADNAFGSLAINNSSANTQESGTQAYSSSEVARDSSGTAIGGLKATGMGGGGGVVTGSAPSAMPVCNGPDCSYDYYLPKYIYTGEQITLTQDKVEVLRRINKIDYSGSISGLLGSFGFGLADIGGFDGARLQSVNLVQDKDFGYAIYINFDEGTISIDAYWPKWPHQQYTNCKGEVCTMTTEDWKNISSADVPPDEQLISMANSFAEEHGIDLSYYGQPEVMKDWLTVVPMRDSATTVQPYISDTISINYPLMINNKYVYEQNGSKFGLTIVVNIRFNKVSGVYGLYTQDYESSAYDAETDFSKITALAEKGGVFNYVYYDASAKTKEVELGTPEEAYAVSWQYDQNSQNSKMLIVPSLVFPITKNFEENNAYIYKIVIPLAKEMLEQYNNPTPPVPVPLMGKSVSE